MNDFYLTLISNSTSELYPSNITSSFMVQLPRKIVLNEEFVVGLAEIQFPYNFFNITQNNNLFTFVSDSHKYNGSISPGFYNSVSDIIDEVLNQTRADLGDWLRVDRVTNRTEVIKTEKLVARLSHSNSLNYFHFHGRLATQLGFAPDTNVFKYELSPYVGNIYFGVPEQLFVYCDLVEPQMIGYESSQILKIVNTTNSEHKFGTPCHRAFQKIHYIPVMKKEFESVEINLRDIAGQLFPFCHGVVLIKLHFKEKQLKLNSFYHHGN